MADLTPRDPLGAAWHPDAAGTDADLAEAEALRAAFRATPEGRLAVLFEQVECDQHEADRRSALRAEGIADAVGYARTHAFVYADLPGADGERAAVDAAVLEASARLRVPEDTVRALAYTADTAREHLPRLWELARSGFTPLSRVQRAIALLPRFGGDADHIARLDAHLARIAPTATSAAFGRAAARLARRLTPEADAVAHRDAFGRRTVTVDDAGDGMSRVTAYISTVDAVAIKRRLTATAKHATKADRDARSRDQLRADLFVDWLRGTGTPTAVKTKVFVTVPLDALAEGARASVRHVAGTPDELPVPGIDVAAEPLVLGGGPVDHATARRLLLESGRFTRVITDPVTGAILDMDRRSRLVTRAQREWLLLTHHLCTRDGCNRAAIDAEIDHWSEYHGPGRGRTDLANLHPLCGSDHRHKGRTRIRFARRRSGSVQLTFPTGYRTSPEPETPGARHLAAMREHRSRHPLPEDPPF